ncbi:hypothetical protein EUTSA_v10023970mg [Eutrema salsugineum]|uniref:Micro-fibrillar-associated protein 1 C-terminal domain-containing protein n=1 Tax=Eutrema salsugineum TaxID=72664 RepID=V4MEH4_EUTSA|nr:hypothetical protein EUTSA_v10023970mg [Eutrema salsugineum]
MIKPVFVRKSERDTVAERERLEAKKEALEELAKRKMEMRKAETKQLVVEKVRKDEEIEKNKLLEEANIEDVETDDEINEVEEYEAWKFAPGCYTLAVSEPLPAAILKLNQDF